MKRKKVSVAALSLLMLFSFPVLSWAKPQNTEGKWYNHAGKWYFGKDEKELLKGWIVSDGDWYYLDTESGALQSGWLDWQGKKYFLNTVHDGQFGKLLSGWQWIDGYCYYFEGNDTSKKGELQQSGTTVDGYTVDAAGHYVANGEAVYVAGKGLPGTEGGKAVAGASRNIPSRTGNRHTSGSSFKGQPSDKKESPLADGTYYGTAKEGIYFQEKGANVVKVVVSDGKIASAESVLFKDSSNPVVFAQYRDRFLERVKGLDSMEEVRKSVNNKAGKYYDGLSGATMTLKAHTSALENAVWQAKKKKEGSISPFSYMDFSVRPEASQSGKTLDLSATRLKLHFPDGQEKEIAPSDFVQYGITMSPADGSPMEENGKEILVHFTQKDMDLDLVSAIVPRAVIRKKYPSAILVQYADGEKKEIPLNQDHFRYTLPAKGKIDSMCILDGKRELQKATYDAASNLWTFSLKDVAHDGFSSWGYELYTVKVDSSQDSSPILSFTLDSHLAKKDYYLGEALKLDDLMIEAHTKEGNTKLYSNWEEAKAAGFTSDPENNTALDSVGEHTVRILYQKGEENLSQSLSVHVVDASLEMPSKLEIRTKAGELVKTYTFSEEDWKKSEGGIKRIQEHVAKKFKKDWDAKEFTAKAFNKKGEELSTEVSQRRVMFRVQFPNYQSSDFVGNGTFTASFLFTEEDPDEEENPSYIQTFYGESEVKTIHRYNAKVKVLWDSRDKSIVRVADNGTEPGGNKRFWTRATDKIFSALKGKKREEVDGVDAVARATYSSHAILDAVKKAIPEE